MSYLHCEWVDDRLQGVCVTRLQIPVDQLVNYCDWQACKELWRGKCLLIKGWGGVAFCSTRGTFMNHAQPEPCGLSDFRSWTVSLINVLSALRPTSLMMWSEHCLASKLLHPLLSLCKITTLPTLVIVISKVKQAKAQAGNELSNILPKSSHARKKPPPNHKSYSLFLFLP